MVDLKDRVNKPRKLVGTPSYAQGNILSLGFLGIGLVLSAGYMWIWFNRKHRYTPDYGRLLEDEELERKEVKLKKYVDLRLKYIKEAHETEKEDEVMRGGT